MKEESGRWSREERRKKRGDKRRVEWKRERELKRCHAREINRRGKVDDYAKERWETGWMSRQKAWWTKGTETEKEGGTETEKECERHLWVSLLVGNLEKIDGVSQGGFLQCQGEDQGELFREAARKHLTGNQKFGKGSGRRHSSIRGRWETEKLCAGKFTVELHQLCEMSPSRCENSLISSSAREEVWESLRKWCSLGFVDCKL